tara:strand:- start:299 stop:742 length:444 start_codon:yes stop_codon:yes gene_type:complete
MPTLYTSVLRSNVIEPLESLLKSEFNKLPVFYDIDFKPRGNFFMRFIPMADELDQPTTEDQIRTYGLLMRLYRKIPGVYSRRNNLEQLMNYVDRIKRLIGNNSNYTVSSTYKWNDGVISFVNYEPELSDKELDYQVADIMFNCNVLI